jgi:cation transport ATPase
MLLDLVRAISFFLSILSLYWVMLSAFFVPGSRWQERLVDCLLRVALAACMCFASGLLFSWRPAASREKWESPLSTLPVRLFFFGLAGMLILFMLSWYIEEYYLPFALKG